MDQSEAARLVGLLQKQCADYGRHWPDIWQKVDKMLAQKPNIRRSYLNVQKLAGEYAKAREVALKDTEDYKLDGGVLTDEQSRIINQSLPSLPTIHHDPWPDWCFLPVSLLDHSNPLDFEEVWMNRSRIPEILTLGSWRQTQGVYLVDETVLGELWKTPLTGKIPVELLYRLPEWTTLINLPPGAFEAVADGNPDRMALCHLTTVGQYVSVIIMLMSEYGFSTLSFPLMNTIEESFGFIVRCIENAENNATTDEMKVQAFGADGGGWARRAFRYCAHDIAGVISTLLYLCSEEPDIQGRPVKPVKTMTKNGPRFFPPNKPQQIMVGVRLGAALRRGREARNEPEEGFTKGTHASPRAHIRGAHWHTYLTGPRSAPVPKLKWLPPIPVNTRFGETDAVIHPVEEKVSA